jgi:peptidoglycan/LPS O-acetylase OafA/YrhL
MTEPANRVSSAALGQVCSGPLPPLAGLQFVAIAWIVLNQFRHHLGLEAGAQSGLVAKGYIGAGLFFMVSGYLLCQKYVELRATGAFRFGSLVWRRWAFLYPLHIAILAVMVAALALGNLLGRPVHHTSFSASDLPANLMLVQAWGFLRTDSWNFPSWLISADWFGYLMFPLTAWVALRALRWKLLALGVPLALFAIAFLVAQTQGILFTDMTSWIGALQTVPAYLLGAALWRLDHDLKLSRNGGAVLAACAILWIVISASLRVSDLAIWPAFAPLVLGASAIAKPGIPAWASDGLGYLGRISVAMQLVYLPVDMAYFRAAKLLWSQPRGLEAWLVWSGVFPVILFAAVIAYHGFQRPIAVWLKARNPIQAAGRS